MLVPISDIFHKLSEKDGANVINPITLAVVIVATNYVDKTVMNPACGTWIKNQNVMPEWTKKNVEKMESVKKTTAGNLVKNWGNGNN